MSNLTGIGIRKMSNSIGVGKLFHIDIFKGRIYLKYPQKKWLLERAHFAQAKNPHLVFFIENSFKICVLKPFKIMLVSFEDYIHCI